MRFPLGQMTVGDILDRGLKLLFARLPAFFVINLIVLAPIIAVFLALPYVLDIGRADSDALILLVAVGLFALLLGIVLQPIGTAAILHIVMQEYAGRRAGVGEAFSFALTRFPALLGTSILAGLIILVGFICCIVPGVYFYVTYIFVGQVVVLERLSGGGALQRSQSLIDGFRGRVFGVLLLIIVGTRIVVFAVEQGLMSALPIAEVVPAAGGRRVEFNTTNYMINTLATQLVQILFATFLAVCTTLLYLDLRIRKEGFDLELAAGGVVGGDDVGTGEPRRYEEPPKEW